MVVCIIFDGFYFEVTNGVSNFYRSDNIIRTEKLKDTFSYIDNVAVCGLNQSDHDCKLERFMSALNKYRLIITNISMVYLLYKNIILAHGLKRRGVEAGQN